MGCGAFRDNNCKVGDKVETLCLSSGLFQRILRINQEHASENGKKIMGNAEQEYLCAHASHVGIGSIKLSGKLPTYLPAESRTVFYPISGSREYPSRHCK